MAQYIRIICDSHTVPRLLNLEMSPDNGIASSMPVTFPYDYTVEVRNRFKGLDLIDRVPDELWTEVHDIVQETGIKIIPMEKKCKKANGCLGRPYK